MTQDLQDTPATGDTDFGRAAATREAALRRVLDVISASRDDERPVFKAILEAAEQFCDTPLTALYLVDERRETLAPVAAHGFGDLEPLIERYSRPMAGDDSSLVRCVQTRQLVHLEDMAQTDLYRSGHRYRQAAVEEDGIRTSLAVPMVHEGVGIGVLMAFRREARRFTDAQVELLQTFAAQAIIAIENARQFRELQTRLEREAASAEILQVISRSRDDDVPVFNVITANTLRLTDSFDASLMLVSEDRQTLDTVAADGWGEEIRAYMDENPPQLGDPQSTYARVVAKGEPIQIVDIKETTRYKEGMTGRRLAVDKLGVHTMLHVPLVSGGEVIGVISAFRQEVRAYAPDEIEMLRAFAAQAVIAIENVRQFKALEARTQEVQALNASLEARVEDQVGEIERMGKLKRFLPAAVADAVVTKGEDMLSSHRALIAVLFCDIRGFTAFCETAEPEETIELLQTYHQEMGKLIAEHGAGVDHRSGDGIMVIFNDPLPCNDPAGAALGLARAMHARMVEICGDWRKLGHRLGFGSGLSLGYATVGMVGYEGRYDYTANGPAVNLAARLCEVAADGEILLSPRAHIALGDRVEATSTGELVLKGIAKPVEALKVEG